MRAAIRVISRTLLWLGLALLFAMAVIPLAIGSSGGAGMVAYGVMLISMKIGIPTSAALVAIGGLGGMLARRTA